MAPGKAALQGRLDRPEEVKRWSAQSSVRPKQFLRRAQFGGPREKHPYKSGLMTA
jgi:hypothetical protein